MQLIRLDLSDFKSFAGKTELDILPGMTGIVGPNGCGKSNLVEAMRWVMGETSAKKMRGSGMDDVIFGGTSLRPARDWAEVTLHIDNSRRTAPTAFNDTDDLEITRRIEREQGSDYRVNGKPARARDVQLMFADNASGAQSPALVSQGRVSALIQAKPQDRRMILEDAAGIAGLHGRRHEAELKLKAAEANLVRVEDVIKSYEAQLTSLRRQAQQAVLYRQWGEQIRQAEAGLFWHHWQDSLAAEERARNAFATADNRVAEAMAALNQAVEARQQAQQNLPALRQAQTAAETAFQKLILALDALDAEEKRLANEQAQLAHHLDQLQRDSVRENALLADAQEALQRLSAEENTLRLAQQDETDHQKQAAESVESLRQNLDVLEHAQTQLTNHLADIAARRTALQKRLADDEARLSIIQKRLDEQNALLADLDSSPQANVELVQAEQALQAAEESLNQRRAEAESADALRQEKDQAVAVARQALHAAQAEHAKCKAEIDALTKILNTSGHDLFSPLIDTLTVTPGYEAAVAAAFGEALMAPLDAGAPQHWRVMEATDTPPAWPAHVAPLSQYIQGPAPTSRALAHMGLVPDELMGRRLAADLGPGQVLVTRAGACWRWDGYTVQAGAPSAAVVHLEHRNRLQEAVRQAADMENNAAQCKANLDDAAAQFQAASQQDQQARAQVNEAFNDVGQARNRVAQTHQAATVLVSRRQTLVDGLTRLEEDRREALAHIQDAKDNLANLPDTAADQEKSLQQRAELADVRLRLTEKQSALDRLVKEAADRLHRLNALEGERASWQSRQDSAQSRLAELTERTEQSRLRLEEMQQRPDTIATQRQEMAQNMAAAETAKADAAQALEQAEQAAALCEQAEKDATEILAQAREKRVRAEANVAAAQENNRQVLLRIQEKLSCGPEDLLPLTGVTSIDDLPVPDDLQANVDQWTRERDDLGPVNLRAEMELAELDQQATALKTERDDLTGAIARLRQGIASLNGEARERLLTAFETVNKHFKELFTRLFGGGQAHLSLVETDDPLESGLEIYASPPGKKMQILSLFSGGEQALTAIALIFAVFLTNPSPICVLDEVDAPLDEANVDRFCSLLQDISRAGATRFLVVTHHRLTMARMDRLYGVTMTERGVSQLVSVDLQEAEKIRAAA